MRSRYVAACFELAAYLEITRCPPRRQGATLPDTSANPASGQATVWLHLQILDVKRGQANQTDGEVEFIATYRHGEGLRQLHERSSFVRQQGLWYYTEGRVDDRAIDLPARNASCWCGSGQKYKKCHGNPARRSDG